MDRLKREDIHTISRFSNWKPSGIRSALETHVYNATGDWIKFLRVFFISLGIGFITAGIVFFFAYNWADLHKFVKLGILESLVVATVLLALLSKFNQTIKNILFASATMLVGVMFAVFGQIYQTGANAYDFFLGWTIAVCLWVVVVNYAVLWLLFLTLICTTIHLYSEQVAHDWSETMVLFIQFGINAFFLILAIWSNKRNQIPGWSIKALALACAYLATSGITIGIFKDKEPAFWVLWILTIGIYGSGIMHAIQAKSTFYISVISFSVVVILSALMVKVSDSSEMILTVCFFIIISVTAIIKGILTLQKKWHHE